MFVFGIKRKSGANGAADIDLQPGLGESRLCEQRRKFQNCLEETVGKTMGGRAWFTNLSHENSRITVE